ncbi:TonB-dependent receptor [Flammeovirga sp. MY04]|uniref:SusC/RagA family TonB-linked outer membrane protein n=1 Tax=Flammeovirga sp. MY04 TaxID=1191459 RepID=UPI001452823D|nr:TonB-dependent receptor [Flammeovirga sp. MY04]ANQ47996.2 TonB-dependent receptor [Flammeovirga sp. MY04]
MSINSTKQFAATMLLLLFSLVAFAQERSVSGTVVDENGDPLPGVAVLVKGTTKGGTTDFDGKFKITLADGEDVLVVSYIGYKAQEVTVGTSTNIDVAMEVDAEQLEEVVVIGYGSVKKEDATGSVQAITAEDMNKGAITSPQDLMIGKTAGIQITTSGGAPGANSTIRIRGGASMSANNEPLIVIDGVPVASDGISGMANPLATVNPDDIETFTVLKDASATAIYGSRASNGVIIITTKTGKGDQKLRVDYSSKYSVGFTSNRLKVYNASEYKDLINNTLHSTDTELDQAARAALGDADVDWQNEIYAPAFGMDQNFSFSGGVKNLPYRLSVGYNTQDGVLKSDNIQRTSIGLSLTPKFFDDHLKVNFNAKGTYVENNFANQGAIGGAISFDPTHPIRSGSEAWGGYWQWLDPDTGKPLAFTPVNPVAQLEQVSDRSYVKRGIANLSLDYKFHFLPDLSANMNLGIDASNSNGNKITSPDASWVYQTDEIRGEREVYNQEKRNTVFDFYLKYAKEIGIHRFDVMGGYSWQHFHNEGKNYKNDFFNNRPDPLLDLPFASEYYLVSFYGRANYTLNNKYLFTATVRQDGTSRFAKGNRWGLFPSLALAWKLDQEAFMSGIDWLDELKIRAGWGITGQQDITGNDYVGYGTYTLSNNGAQYVFGDTWFNTYRPNGFDPNLKWEETQNTNIGIDFKVLDSRVSGSFDYYHRETTDLINTVTVAAGTNLSDRIVSNVGSLVNSGVELNILTIPVLTDDFYWELGGNFTYNRNEITKLTTVDDPNYQGLPTGDVGNGNFLQIQQVGQSLNSFYVYEQVYDQAGKPLEGVYKDQNGDGIINADDKIIYGNSVPDYLIGVNTRINYKKWDFSLSGRFQLNAQIYNSVAQGNENWNNVYNASTRALSNRLSSSANTGFLNTDEIRIFSSHWIENADFFRLDNVTVGYTFDSIFGLQDTNMRMYLTGQNLFVASPYRGLDPEVFNGIDSNIYPRPTTILFGLNLGF